LVVCGTGTKRTELVVIEVLETSAAGKSLRLDKPTYFYADAVKSVKPEYLKPTEGRCPPELFLQVRLLVEGALNTLPEGALTKDLAEGAAAPPLTKQSDPQP
jgi:hypothetical protein